jgi:hypothetical protein
MSNNLGRTEVSVSQTQKELAINNSDGVLDAAITAELTVSWSGADALKVLTTTQLRQNSVFVMSGSTSEVAPVLKMAAVQRGLILVDNDLGVDLTITDDSTADEVVISAGVLGAIYVTATGVRRVFEADSIVLPADTSLTCRAATTANITISTALNNGDTIDGVVLATNDRVLVKNQSTGAENGIYVVGAVPARATDFDDGTSEVYAGVLVTVTEGTANADTLWMVSTNNPITVGVTTLTFKQLNQTATTYATNAQVLAGTATSRAVDPAKLASLWKKGSDIASAATISVGNGRYFHVTGTTGITDIDFATATNGREAVLIFDGVLTITHNATSLVLPGGADITTAAGDRAAFIQDNADNVYCVWYQRADGTALINSSGLSASTTTEVLQGTDTATYVTPDALAALWEKGAAVASASTTSLGEGGLFHITGTTTINDIDWDTAKNGRAAVLVFDGILTLTYNATTMKLPGATSITTAAGDTAMFVQDSSDNVICVWYQRADGTPIVSASISAASTTEVLTGTNATKAVTPDALAALWEKGSNIASAATISVGEGGYFHITGTTTITDIDWATAKNGRAGIFIFDGILTLTHNATTLILPTGANITTAAGDRAMFVQDAGDNVYCVWYQRADGTALVSSSISLTSTTEVLTGTDAAKAATADAIAALWEKGADVASAGTISFAEGGYFHITGTTAITDIDWATAKNGRWAWVIFDGILTLTHNATTLLLPGAANITTAANDRALFIQDAADNVYCVVYQRADGTAIDGGGSFLAASTTEALTGTNTTKGVTPDALAALWEKGSNVASAATVSLGEGGLFHITGTTTITDIDFGTAKDGRSAWLIFDGALTLTYNATTLVIDGGASVVTAAGDMAFVTQDSGDNVYVRFWRANGKPTVPNTQVIAIAVSDETSNLSTGTAKTTFRMPFAFTVTDVRASVATVATGGTLLTVDVNESGTSIISTKLTFDASEKTTTTAATPRVISDTSLADDAEITIDIDAVGSTTTGQGLKVYLIGYPTNG